MRAQAPLAACDGPRDGRAFWITASDGVRLRLAHWPAPQPGAGHVLILPGRTEQIEKYGLVAADLARGGWGALVVDWRGQGLSARGHPDALCGHVGDFAEYQRDLDAVRAAAADLAPGPLPWLAHSMGGCIALRGLIRAQARGDLPPAVAFSAPMLGLPHPPLNLGLLRLAAALGRPFGADRRYAPTTGPAYGLPAMGFEGNPLTTDRAQFDRMRQILLDDARLTIAGPSLRWMAAALAEMQALARLPSPPLPALFGLGGDEGIVAPAPLRARAAAWPGAELALYPGARHELLMERPGVRDDFLARALGLFDRTTAKAA